MKLYSKAPMRTDLAGGTLDIYPLYLFTEGGLTVNAAVTIWSEATVETRPDSEIHIIAEDINEELAGGGGHAGGSIRASSFATSLQGMQDRQRQSHGLAPGARISLTLPGKR